MYLKSIEAHGFKSFANNTTLLFNSGITGIVGPNGSGKSNIADAVRWVLGEQKVKQLRSSAMQDVIFSGTENRKPQGYAYVAITLDNKDRKLNLDYDEITVSRRLYRSGESEYMLNGSQVRLKDVSELFYDTGIGKEGYSIIGQGQIDKILSDKPDDRRELFDEAVGIVKYKRRKAIAQKKLDDEKINLSRVSDVIKELDRQVGPLKKQSEDAKEYLKIREELIIFESNLTIRELKHAEEQLKEVKENTEITKNDLNEKRLKQEEIKTKYSKMDMDITNLDLNIASIKDNISNEHTNISNYNGRIAVLNEQINSENQTIENREQRIKALSNDLFDHIGQIENNIKILNILKSQIDFIKDNDKNNEMDKDAIEKDLSKIESHIIKIDTDVKSVMGEDYTLDFDNIKSDTIFEKDSFFLNLDEKRNEVDLVDLKIKELQKKIEELVQTNQDNAKNLRQLNDNLINTQNSFHTHNSKLEAVKNLSERYEGYGQVIKLIMDKKQEMSTIKGVVADLIDTTKEYETCIETALGNNIQNIVTEDADTAKKLIQYLKEGSLGRATFLPLTSVKPKVDDLYTNASKEEGVIGLAQSLVQYEEKYKDLVLYLLSRCLVVKDIDYALKINTKYNHNLKIVTLQGELLLPGGSIAGGSYKNKSNLMGRKRELDDLTNICKELKNEIDNINVEKQKLSNEYDNLYEEIEQNKQKLNLIEIEKNTKMLNIISEIKLEYSSISNKTDFTCQTLDRLIEEFSKIFEEKNAFEDKTNSSASIIDEKNEEIKQLSYKIEELNILLKQYDDEIIEKTKEKELLLASRDEYFESTDKITEDIVHLEKELIRLQNQIEKHESTIQNISSHMYDDYQLTMKECEEKYSNEYDDTNELKSMIKERQKRIREMGPININAIEEYKGVSERYELLSTQYSDITKAEATLIGIIKELDDGMRKLFDQNFKVIKNEFDRVFKELFGGGKATLEIVETDSKDILDAGIAIVAQPPGKKLQNMMQLSGGEKALTAIALLFGIQYLKPSPFCMLDEIEAALDESNVDRFADYLHNLTDKTQFILITHRRGTMEKADRLYGITMQEKGVSALVSVDLIQDQLDD
ncbi:MAG: chromosome segregation protein SMC [Eubacteriales bacterium]|nr:chromosome segregation protein SMC [Eubacteriales bacterium]